MMNVYKKEVKPDEMKRIQLEILKSIDEFSKEHQIQYFLFYGTLLGAIRHNGYIPWDDDVDICMTRENFVKFVSQFNNEQNEYKVRDRSLEYDFPFYFAKIVDTNTHLYEVIDGKSYDIGINVDLFPLDYVPSEIKVRKQMQKRIRRVKVGMLVKTIDRKAKRSLKKRVVLKCMDYIFKKKTYEYCWKIQQIVQRYSKYESDELIEIMTPYGENAILHNDCFKTSMLCSFEGLILQIPKEYDQILSKIYGDYMTLPPKEQQISHHTYKTYIKDNNQIRKEGEE